ncbi:MAG: hypothetical protein M1608_14680 [Candidatus Omnitrophica bacterium]|nr:hypothetical protein [Candidatus Omnitrophota bacterium]
MKSRTQNRRLHLNRDNQIRSVTALAAMALWGTFACGGAMSTNVNWKADATLKETYDSNVYLQDQGPADHVPGAVPAKKGSFMTTVSPRLFLDYTACPAFHAGLSYTPDYNWYHEAPSEDNMAHRWGLNLGGDVAGAVWNQQNSFTYIDGSREGLIFGRPGDVPAIGGVPLRDRRAAFIYKGGFGLTETFGKWMVRPVASALVQDFMTYLRENPPDAVYENYIPRQDINGGLDAGYEVAGNLRAVLGYRYGRQDQFDGPFGPGGTIIRSPYGNSYHRVLAGAEGAPFDWLKLSVLAGPDIRQFDHSIPGFDADEMLYYVNGSITFIPSRQDSITFSNVRYEQPAFSSFSMYEDVTYSLNWNHRFDDHWAAGAGFRLYIGDWQAPVSREDWIYTPSVDLTYRYNEHLSAELAYSYDWAENMAGVAPGQTFYADGREFTRHLVTLGLRYAL